MSDIAGGGARPAQGPRPRPRRRLSKAALRPALKRTLDVTGAALLLLLVAPTFVLVFLLVRAADGGPAFVSRRRVGRGGREFRYLTFAPRRRTLPATAAARRIGRA